MPRKKEIAKKEKTVIDGLIEKLEEALAEKTQSERSIKRTGSHIIVPEFMSLADAAKSIEDFNESMEETVDQTLTFYGHPNELLVAMDRGIKNCFGNFFGKGKEIATFFGAMRVKAQTTTVPISATEKITVPVGHINIPGLPVSLDISMDTNKKKPLESQLYVECTYKQKYEPLVVRIKESIDEELKNQSVFKGQAINSNFDFLDLSSFDTDKIVYSKNMQTQLDANIICPIKFATELENKGMHLRRSILLHGAFGSGKTLTALYVAKHAVENGWTFLNVLPNDDIANAIKFAERYQPAVVFFEDIDQATPHGRTSAVNEILNTVDGFLSKKSKVMTILTTNHTERIERAMLRPGRIDAVIRMGDIDEQVIEKMVQVYCPEMTNGKLDSNRLLEVAEGYTPSFVTEALHRAALYAISRSNGNGKKPKVTTEDLVQSLQGLRDQFVLMQSEGERKEESRIEEVIANVVDKQTKDSFDTILEALQKIR